MKTGRGIQRAGPGFNVRDTTRIESAYLAERTAKWPPSHRRESKLTRTHARTARTAPTPRDTRSHRNERACVCVHATHATREPPPPPRATETGGDLWCTTVRDTILVRLLAPLRARACLWMKPRVLSARGANTRVSHYAIALAAIPLNPLSSPPDKQSKPMS